MFSFWIPEVITTEEGTLVRPVKTLMTLRGINQTELSKLAGVSITALSRFFNENTELRAESIFKVLGVLGVDIERATKHEINKALGNQDEITVGEDLAFLLDKSDPITRRTIADSLLSNFKKSRSPELKTRLGRIQRYRDSIKTVRRVQC